VSILSIGPVPLDAYDHGNPSFSWSSDAGASGMRRASISGLLPWTTVKTLSEFVANPHAYVTIHGIEGVVDEIVFGGDLFASLSGLYLMSNFSFDPAKAHTMDPEGAPFSMSAAYLEDMLA
jgi:hypothetical protein